MKNIHVIGMKNLKLVKSFKNDLICILNLHYETIYMHNLAKCMIIPQKKTIKIQKCKKIR